MFWVFIPGAGGAAEREGAAGGGPVAVAISEGAHHSDGIKTLNPRACLIPLD
jgi:hypothetical protein